MKLSEFFGTFIAFTAGRNYARTRIGPLGYPWGK